MLPRLFFALLLASPLAAAAPGDADPDFGTAGVTLIDFTPLAGAGNSQGDGDVAVDSAGRLLVAFTVYGATSSGVGLARLLRDGSLDPSFGSGGIVYHTPANFSRFVKLRVDEQDRPLIALHSGEGPARVWRICRFQANGTFDAGFFGSNCASAAPGNGAHIQDLVQSNGNWWAVGGLTINNGVVQQGVVVAQIDPTAGVVRSESLFPNAASVLAGGASALAFGEGVAIAGAYATHPVTQFDAAVFHVSYGGGQFFSTVDVILPFDRGGGNDDFGRCIVPDAAGGYLIGVEMDRAGGGQQWGSFRITNALQRDQSYAPGYGFEGRTVDNIVNVADYGANSLLDGCTASADGSLNLYGRHVFPDPLGMGANSVVGALFRMAGGGRDTRFGGPAALPVLPYDPPLASVGTAIHLVRAPADPHPRGDTIEGAAATPDGNLVVAGISFSTAGKYTAYVMKLHQSTLFRGGFED